MASSLQTSKIHGHVARAKQRLRLQAAFETATIALVPAAIACAIALILSRHGVIGSSQFGWTLLVAVLAVLIASVVAAAKPISSISVSTSIDRASGLSDRLTNAYSFGKELKDSPPTDKTTLGFMQAAVLDGVNNAKHAKVDAATPFSFPEWAPHAFASLIGLLFLSVLYQPRTNIETALSPRTSTPEELPSNEEPVELDPEDSSIVEDTIAAIRETADATGDKELEELANQLDTLVKDAKDGKLTQRQLLDKAAELEKKYAQVSEAETKEALDELKKTGKELQKNKDTKELGNALVEKNLEKAEKELEKLAANLENGTLSDKKRQNIAKSLSKASKAYSKREKTAEQKLEKQIRQAKEQLKRFKAKQEAAKTDREKEALTRKREKKQRELERLERKKQAQNSPRKRQLKQLHRKLDEAAKSMERNTPESRRQASRTMRDIQRSTGKIKRDQRRIANKKRVASQMNDLKEALRRAKRKKGQNSRFGKNRRESDFRRRAQGKKGQKGAWKPGGRSKGSGSQAAQNGGSGDEPGENAGGDLLGESTKKTGKTKDVGVQGVQGKGGTSIRETLLSAAEKGFSSQNYKDVYQKYAPVAEEVIESEKVPTSYKYYVRRYFKKIKPVNLETPEASK